MLTKLESVFNLCCPLDKCVHCIHKCIHMTHSISSGKTRTFKSQVSSQHLFYDTNFMMTYSTKLQIYNCIFLFINSTYWESLVSFKCSQINNLLNQLFPLFLLNGNYHIIPEYHFEVIGSKLPRVLVDSL